jgi:hypothetical protein
VLTATPLPFTLFAVTNDPVLIAYAVRRAKNKRAVWTRIGQAYPHEQGAGLTMILDAVPADGRIVLLERGDDDDGRLQREAARMARSDRKKRVRK